MQQRTRRGGMQLPREVQAVWVLLGGWGRLPRSVQQPTVPSCEHSPPCTARRELSSKKTQFLCCCLLGESRPFWAAVQNARIRDCLLMWTDSCAGHVPWSCSQGQLVVYPVHQYLLLNTAVPYILPSLVTFLPCFLIVIQQVRACKSTVKGIAANNSQSYFIKNDLWYYFCYSLLAPFLEMMKDLSLLTSASWKHFICEGFFVEMHLGNSWWKASVLTPQRCCDFQYIILNNR